MSVSETEEHKLMKKYFFDYIDIDNPKRIKNKDMEIIVGNNKPDVYFKLSDNKEIAIECQYSHINKEEVVRRTRSYTENNIYALWVLHINLLNINDECTINISSTVNLLFNMYHGRVYIFDTADLNRRNFRLYTCNFYPYSEPRESKYYGSYKKYFKKRRYVIKERIIDLSFFQNDYYCKLVDYNFKLARFRDQHLLKKFKLKVIDYLEDLYNIRNIEACKNCYYSDLPHDFNKCHSYDSGNNSVCSRYKSKSFSILSREEVLISKQKIIQSSPSYPVQMIGDFLDKLVNEEYLELIYESFMPYFIIKPKILNFEQLEYKN